MAEANAVTPPLQTAAATLENPLPRLAKRSRADPVWPV
jgi:hypothetical protein